MAGRFGNSALVLVLCAGSAGADGLPQPVTDADFAPVPMAEVHLGQLLFYDPILSGNGNISCATCHHPRFGTSDGVSLGLGEGGVGLGPARRPDPANLPEQRVPRNAPALFNLGATAFTSLFYDGRVEVDASRASGFRTPLEDAMVVGFASVLSAQTMFPVLSPDEMAGHYSENDISRAVRQGRLTGPGGAWEILTARVTAIPEYAGLFADVYGEIAAGRPVHFTDIANAIATFITYEWRADDSPFDRALRGELVLQPEVATGQALFYGRAGCAVCHSGPFQTDHDFHAMGDPQLGPGKTERFERGQDDLGRMRVTGREEDAFAIRTPSLRNLRVTAPYGHAGAFAGLRAYLRHHADPVAGLESYMPQAVLPDFVPEQADWSVMEDAGARAAIAAAVVTPPMDLSEAEFDALLAFLDSLTDPASLNGRLGVPDNVPSGLSVDQ